MATIFTEELKEEVILEYKSRMAEFEESQRPLHTLDVVKDLATEYGSSANGIRMMLSKAGVYIKKADAPKTSTSAAPKRMSKEAAHQALVDAIEAFGIEADKDIISKLSGVAAQYLSTVLVTVVLKAE